MFLSRFFKALGIICIVLAVFLLWQRNNPKRLMFSSFFPTKVETLPLKNSQPIRLIIRNSNIDLPIIPAKIKGQRWETTTQGVSWLTLSSLPGEQGNGIIYGHNWTNILGNLLYVKTGYEIEIVYKDGTKKNFIVDHTALVSPKDVSVLNQSKDKRITLYTCAGILDEKRFVVSARLKQDFSKSIKDL